MAKKQVPPNNFKIAAESILNSLNANSANIKAVKYSIGSSGGYSIPNGGFLLRKILRFKFDLPY